MKNEFDGFQENNNSDSNIITEILQRYLPYWPIFLLAVILSLTSSFYYLRYVTYLYNVSAKILVKDEKKGVDASKVLDALNLGKRKSSKMKPKLSSLIH